MIALNPRLEAQLAVEVREAALELAHAKPDEFWAVQSGREDEEHDGRADQWP